MVDIFFPNELNLENLCRFSLDVGAIGEVDEVSFHAGPTRRITPTAMLLLAKVSRRRAREYGKRNFRFYGLKNHKYANFMGFSHALGVTTLGKIGDAPGGNRYLPIQILKRSDI